MKYKMIEKIICSLPITQVFIHPYITRKFHKKKK